MTGKKLWHKNYDLDKQMEEFTVGDDYILDLALVEADVLGSIAHAKMLSSIGILTSAEFKRLKRALVKLLKAHEKGRFEIRREQEDVHTAVEAFLTAELGDLGKKIHTGRSRNDQVIVDIRIYSRDRLLDVMGAALDLVSALADFADKHKKVPIPGRTHTQRAMPSSVGLWSAAFAESLLDDMELLRTAYDLNNQCPLGSAASYGVPLDIDRAMTSRLLGFAKVQNNVLYANNSRGKMEGIVLFAAAQVMQDLAKLSGDLILFSIPEFGYFTLPDEYCPGSSIMPQKKNPGPLELVRAKASVTASLLTSVLDITRNLPSGYNRDLQVTKKPLMEGLATTESSLNVMSMIFRKLKVNERACVEAFTPDVFAADEAIELAKKGVPFREAYRRVGLNLEKLAGRDPRKNILSKKHIGAPGNLGLAKLRARIKKLRRAVAAEGKRIAAAKKGLLEL